MKYALIILLFLLNSFTGNAQKKVPEAACSSVRAICIERDGQSIRALQVTIAGSQHWYNGVTLNYTIEQFGTALFTINQEDLGGTIQTLISTDLNTLVNGQTYQLHITNDDVKCSFVANFKGCSRPDPTISYSSCCPTENLIFNGGFESGNTGFTSDYQDNGSSNNLSPNHYDILSNSTADKYCDSWSADDHTTFCDKKGNFLVVNGLSSQQQNINNTIWKQDIQYLIPNKTYKVCAYFRHLQTNCFDTRPKVRITTSTGNSSNWTSISTGPNSCDWQALELSFLASSNSLTIKIEIDQTPLGDGNDLAVDDIALHQIPKSDFEIYADLQSNTNSEIEASGSINGPTIDDDLLPDESCKYAWIVGRYDPTTTSIVDAPIMIDANGMPNGWGLTTNFSEYPFQTSTISNQKLYIAILFLYDCECFENSYSYAIFGAGKGRRKKINLNNQQQMRLRKEIASKLNSKIK